MNGWAKLSGSVVTVGNFDGVHLGHQAILQALTEEAKRRSLPSVAIFFDPHPTVVLGTKIPPQITTLQERISLIKSFGVDHVFVQTFSKELSTTSASSYLGNLVKDLGMTFLCVGPTTHIGKGREGTPSKMEELGKEQGFDVSVVSEFFLGEKKVSSSRIRRLIEEGDVELAGKSLGRPYRMIGTVVSGDGRGTKLGFPTANLEEIETLIPARGVYAVWADVDGIRVPAAANVGYRPTIQQTPRFTVEVHLLDFEKRLVAQALPVTWVARIRDEQKFESLNELKVQIKKDCLEARKLLGA